MKEHSMVRKIIVFAIFFVALGVIAPAIVFYSLGYRFDKNNSVVVRSGSIVLKSTPANPKIVIDGGEVSEKSMDLINRSLNINGLGPKDYQLEANAPGYFPWKKTVEVHSGIATEFWNIVLVPQLVESKTLVEENIIKYAFSPDKKFIAYFINKDDYLSIYVRDLDQNKDSFVYKETLNQRFVSGPGELKWSPDGQWLLFSLKNNTAEEIFLANADSNYSEVITVGNIWKNSLVRPLENQNSKIKKTPVVLDKSILFSWDDQNKIFFSFGGSVYSQTASSILEWWNNKTQSGENENSAEQLGQKKDLNSADKLAFDSNHMPLKIKDSANGYAFCGNYLCLVNVAERKLLILDRDGGMQNSVDFPENYQMTEKYQIFAYSEEQVAIQDDKHNLFLWDYAQNKEEGKEGMKFIFPGVEEVYFSDDGKKLLFSTKNEAYVYFVKDWEVQPKHVSGDMEVIYRDSEELQKVQWYLDYQNIFVVNKNAIKMIELDSRGGRNTADFLKNPGISEISYDTNAKKFWFLQDQGDGIKKLQEITFPVTAGIFSGIMNSAGN